MLSGRWTIPVAQILRFQDWYFARTDADPSVDSNAKDCACAGATANTDADTNTNINTEATFNINTAICFTCMILY